MKVKKYISLIITLFAMTTAWAGIPDRPNCLVNDYAGVFSSSQTTSMEQSLRSLDDSTGNQIVVVTVTDLEGYDIADYATQLGRKWGVGQKGHDNGVVIVVKIKNKTKGQAFIAPGYGLEGALPDATCKHIVDREMIPHFKNNDYYGGVKEALDVIIPIVKGEYSSKDYEKKDDSAGWIILLVIFGVVTVLVIFDKFGLFGKGGGTTYGSSGTSYTGSTYWGGGFGGSSSGGFGGFGGGSFGGGGAGGSW